MRVQHGAGSAWRVRTLTALVLRTGDHTDYQYMLSLEYRKANAARLCENRLARQRISAAKSRQHARRLALVQS